MAVKGNSWTCFSILLLACALNAFASTMVDRLLPIRSNSGAQFGTAIASSSSELFVGAPVQLNLDAAYHGFVYVYETGDNDPEHWILKQLVENEDPSLPECSVPVSYFGFSLAWTRNYLYVGNPGNYMYNTSCTGNVQVFRRSGVGNYTFHSIIRDPVSSRDGLFGSDVCLS